MDLDFLPFKDPVHCIDNKWYYWESNWKDKRGPFDSEKLAEDDMVVQFFIKNKNHK